MCDHFLHSGAGGAADVERAVQEYHSKSFTLPEFRQHAGQHPVMLHRYAKENDNGTLRAYTGPYPVDMKHAPSTGHPGPVMDDHEIGADIIRLNAGDGFVPHTHPGHHILAVLAGDGVITYGGVVYPTHAGLVYLVQGAVAHGVGAIDDHVILAVGAPHKSVDSPERMKPAPYEAVLAEMDSIFCLICQKAAKQPRKLHDENCPHCPCYECLPQAGNTPKRRAEKFQRHQQVMVSKYGPTSLRDAMKFIYPVVESH